MNTMILPTRKQVRAERNPPGVMGTGLCGMPALPGIPGVLPTRPELAEWANLALWCDDAGLVRTEHWHKAYNAQEVVLAALADWANGQSGLTRIGCGMMIGLAEGHLGGDSDWETVLLERGQNPKLPHLAISLWPKSPIPHFHIGSTLLSLETECPGLSQTALSILRDAADITIDVIDPARVFRCASWAYWFGEMDETVALEEMGEDCEEDMNMPRRKDFDAHAPLWAWFPRKELGMRALAKAASNPDLTDQARTVAEASLSLGKLMKRGGLPDPYTGLRTLGHLGAGASLWWSEDVNCLMGRVWDDFENQMLQYGEEYSEGFGIDTFVATQIGFNGWLKQKSQWFEVTRGLETLIGRIGKEIERDHDD